MYEMAADTDPVPTGVAEPRFLKQRGPEQAERVRSLEVENDVEGGLVVVLGLVEECGVDPVGFEAHGKAGMQAVVKSDARLRGQRIATVVRRLRLQVSSANDGVRPGFEAVTAATDAESTAPAKILHMFILEDRRGEARDNVTFDGKPTVGKVADRGVGANEGGINNVRLEAVKIDTEGQLPAVIVAIAVDEVGFRSRGSGNGSGGR